jgi:hypothetical protein
MNVHYVATMHWMVSSLRRELSDQRALFAGELPWRPPKHP